jgi:dGTPase
MIDHVVQDLIQTTAAALGLSRVRSIDEVRARAQPLVGLSDSTRAEHLELKAFLREHVYRHYRVLRMTNKARRVLRELFEVLMTDIALLPPDHRDAAQREEAASGKPGRARIVADYVAGMTDRYAILEHRRLFNPDARS